MAEDAVDEPFKLVAVDVEELVGGNRRGRSGGGPDGLAGRGTRFGPAISMLATANLDPACPTAGPRQFPGASASELAMR